ncbi:MAG: DUF790 family protein [Sandaracinaceae bacterium]|nr:DUF790 family protein [Sandaracinaceae bacterium]
MSAEELRTTRTTRTERVLSPRWLEARDEPAIGRILALYVAHVGRPRRELDEALARDRSTMRSEPGPEHSQAELDARRTALVIRGLDRHLRTHVEASVPPRALREALFAERARSSASRDEVVGAVSAALGTSVETLDHALFADLPLERILAFDGAPPSLAALRGEANRVLVEQLFARSREIEVRLWEGARAVVRAAQRGGLLVSARREDERARAQRSLAELSPPDRACTVLTISGPFALFRHTRLYAAATRSLVPVLAQARFEARVRVPGPLADWTFRLSSDDPFLAAFEGRAASEDRQLEAAFAKRFPRIAPSWALEREPEPILLGSGELVFPDFRLIERRAPHRVAWLEIVGFWTPESLERKLSALREAGIANLILAVSERLATREAELSDDPRLVRFKGRVDPHAVLARLEAHRV